MDAFFALSLGLLLGAAAPFPRAGMPRVRWVVGVIGTLLLAVETLALATWLGWMGLFFVGDAGGHAYGLLLPAILVGVAGVWGAGWLLRLQARALHRNLAWLRASD